MRLLSLDVGDLSDMDLAIGLVVERRVGNVLLLVLRNRCNCDVVVALGFLLIGLLKRHGTVAKDWHPNLAIHKFHPNLKLPWTEGLALGSQAQVHVLKEVPGFYGFLN